MPFLEVWQNLIFRPFWLSIMVLHEKSHKLMPTIKHPIGYTFLTFYVPYFLPIFLNKEIC